MSLCDLVHCSATVFKMKESSVTKNTYFKDNDIIKYTSQTFISFIFHILKDNKYENFA